MRGTMARKESITITDILNTAFTLTREEGIAGVTARNVAKKAGCSTQPIFRVYHSMEELWRAVYEKAVSFFEDYYEFYPKMGDTPFLNIGMAYISFAREEKNLFKLLFIEEMEQKKSLYEILNGSQGSLVAEIRKASQDGCEKPEEMFMRMWLFIHGAACMCLTGDYDLSDKETRELLIREYANGQ